MEGRQELFEKEEDWFKFFAQVSELYNCLPNVFILFTMTLNLRNRLHARMEKQFQDRIKRDQRFLLHDIPDDEVLTLYRKRVASWLGDALGEVREKITGPDYRFLPFTQEEILGLNRHKTLREILEALDQQFRDRLNDVTIRDPFYEYLATRNEVRRKEEETGVFQYTGNHLDLVQKLFEIAGGWISQRAGIVFAGADWKKTEDQVPALRLEFRGTDTPWIRVFLARLPSHYKALLPGCVGLLYSLATARNFLWLVRPNHLGPEVEKQKPGQCFARELPIAAHTSLQAILRLLAKKDEYPADAWAKAEELIYDEIKKTYLGELLQQAREAIEHLQSGQASEDDSAPAAVEGAPVSSSGGE